jgi:hypothetical protein
MSGGRFGCLGLLLAILLVFLIELGAPDRRRGETKKLQIIPLKQRRELIRQAAPDVYSYLPIHFDGALDNPCFRNGSSLLCLPAFFVAGGMQCGGWDLWARLKAHEHISDHHDAAPHWWTNHPRSRAGYFDRYLSLFSDQKTIETVTAEPRTLLGDVSPASFAFMIAEQLRLHYQYLDAFDVCYRACRGRSPPREIAARCADRRYQMQHCYTEASAATSPPNFNVPAFAATVLHGAKLKVVLLLRDPSVRLWIAFKQYGQYAAVTPWRRPPRRAHRHARVHSRVLPCSSPPPAPPLQRRRTTSPSRQVPGALRRARARLRVLLRQPERRMERLRLAARPARVRAPLRGARP